MMLTNPDVDRYIAELAKLEAPVLAEMQAAGEARAFPIIGPVVGTLCEQLSRAGGARDVFEMGSGFGYFTYWFARAVPPDGRVVHTDTDGTLGAEARTWLKRGKLLSRVHFELGDALVVLTRFPGPFDVIFIDAEKHSYPEALELARDRVRVGGPIITDNMLWGGKVLEPPPEGPNAPSDPATAGVREYTRRALLANELLTTVLSIGDGVSVSLRVA
jgi:predicted O-methyltransferase YrrM